MVQLASTPCKSSISTVADISLQTKLDSHPSPRRFGEMIPTFPAQIAARLRATESFGTSSRWNISARQMRFYESFLGRGRTMRRYASSYATRSPELLRPGENGIEGRISDFCCKHWIWEVLKKHNSMVESRAMTIAESRGTEVER